MKTIQCHRFGDKVAVSAGSGETVYLRVTEARKLARAINAASLDIKERTFSLSRCGTFSLTVDGSPHATFAEKSQRIAKERA